MSEYNELKGHCTMEGILKAGNKRERIQLVIADLDEFIMANRDSYVYVYREYQGQCNILDQVTKGQLSDLKVIDFY